MHTEPEPTRNTGRNLPGFGFLPCLFPQPQVSPAGKRPNIIFLITDDQSPRMFNFLPEGKGNKPAPQPRPARRRGDGSHAPTRQLLGLHAQPVFLPDPHLRQPGNQPEVHAQVRVSEL
jgi:hypothetical protein